ncbi:armadillo-like helical domain-containing protein 4 [Polyodon spathula]|uniref:armadillo-like helical domain-containing protein 4 n=1 Tax=Polyodon spathula TaxID=7913 RepID=UPI001B7E1F07|nr:armadillo-like helical domain-containing protein 4 [Polyodon spathula]
MSETPPPGTFKSSEKVPHGMFRNPKTTESGTFGNPKTPPSRIYTSATPPLTTGLPPTSVTMATSLMWPPAEAGLDDLEKLESEEEHEDNIDEDEDEEEEEEEKEESPDSDEAESVPPLAREPQRDGRQEAHPCLAPRNQGLVRSWVETVRDKAGYVLGMLAPVGIGIVGALFILGALYSIKIMHRKRRSGFKRQRRKHGEMSNRQDRVMLLADSSEDEF